MTQYSNAYHNLSRLDNGQLGSLISMGGPTGAAAQTLLQERTGGLSPLVSPGVKNFRPNLPPNVTLQKVQGASSEGTIPDLTGTPLAAVPGGESDRPAPNVNPPPIQGYTVGGAGEGVPRWDEPPANPYSVGLSGSFGAPEAPPPAAPAQAGAPIPGRKPQIAGPSAPPDRRPAAQAAPPPLYSGGNDGPSGYSMSLSDAARLAQTGQKVQMWPPVPGGVPGSPATAAPMAASPVANGPPVSLQPEGRPSPEVPSAVIAPDPHQPGHKTAADSAPSKDPMRETRGMAMIAAGLGMMASRNPTALGGIGEGGLQGLQYYQRERDSMRQDERYKRQEARYDQQADALAEYRSLQMEIARRKAEQDAAMKDPANNPKLALELRKLESEISENEAQAKKALRAPAGGGEKDPQKRALELEYLQARIDRTRRPEGGGGSTDRGEFNRLKDVLRSAEGAADAKIEAMRPTERRKVNRSDIVSQELTAMGYDPQDFYGKMRGLTGVKGAQPAAPSGAGPLDNDPLGLR